MARLAARRTKMKKLIMGLVAVATLGAALPAAAQGIVVGENRHGNVVVRPAGYGYGHHYRHHYHHRWHHRHWR
jgi:hypothetical protein